MSLFITLEGVEGSGKSTQIRHIREHLERRGHPLTMTREPGGCPIADAIRSILLDPANRAIVPRAEVLLYNAARAQHVEEVIRPALAEGRTVLCDRFFDATIAYQGGGRMMDIDLLKQLHCLATDDLSPDLTLILDIPANVGLARARRRNRELCQEDEGRFELEEVAFHERVRRCYLDLAAEDARCRVVDGTGEEGAVRHRVIEAIDLFLQQEAKG